MAQINLGRIGFVNKGSWDAGENYKLNDVVKYGGSTYAAKRPNIDITPPTNGTDTDDWYYFIDGSDYAHNNGDETKNFKVADAVEINEAINKKQFDDAAVKLTGNQTVAGVKTFSSNIDGNINGNSGTATKLATARTINGVAFDGSANIAVPTNLGITAGTTAGPIVTSSTGTNATLPTASATASGVVTTEVQTIAGVKTFSSSPIVPVPTTNFQSVPLRSTNITVNVGAGQTYTTINQALEYLSGFYPMYKKSGVTATINLKAGFVMAEQVLVSGIDLGWITIIGEDAETIITHTALTTFFNSGYPAFGVDKGGTSPVIGQLFRFNVEKVGGNKHGLMSWGAGSSANILPTKGFIGAGGCGIYALDGSTITAREAICSNAGSSGIYVNQGSTVNANGANCSSAGINGIHAERASAVDAREAICSNAGTSGIYSNMSSTVNAPSANCSNAGINGIYSREASIINAPSANCSNAGVYGIIAANASIINATSVNCSNAGTDGVRADFNSTINAYNAIIQDQTTGTARVSVINGSTIEASGINTTGGTVPEFNQAVNTLTQNGIIYR